MKDAELKNKLILLEQSLAQAAGCLRDCHDGEGLCALSKSAGYIGDIAGICACSEGTEILKGLSAPLRALYDSMLNEDITGMADIIEFTLRPLVQKWVKEAERK